ncbi:MAG: RNA methyltransferase [Planctomycetaceae bacterium]
MTLELKNPHSLLAVLETRPDDVAEIRLSERSPRGAWEEVAAKAGGLKIPVHVGGPVGGRRDRSRDGGRSQVAVGVVRERSGVGLTELWAGIDAGDRGIWLALDRLQDPHNVGAIFRTAAFFGVRGILLTKNQSAPLSGTAYDVASGGLEHVPFAIVSNLARALQQARDAGLWVLGTSERGTQDLDEVDHERNWLVVVGSEERGLRRLTLEHCDIVSRVSARGAIASLNASVATAVVLSTLCRSE